MCLINSLVSKRGNQIILLPLSNAPWEATNKPCTWKIGKACNKTSPFFQPQNFFSTSALLPKLPWVSIAPLLLPVVPEVYRMAARSSSSRLTVLNLSDCVAARSKSVPVRSSPKVKTFLVPALNATCDTQEKFLGLHTITTGSALPMKYSISAA